MSDHHLLTFFHEPKAVYFTESKASHPNFPGGTAGALQLISDKWLKIKSTYDILGVESKIKVYYLE